MEMVKLMIIYVELYVSKKNKKNIWLVFFLCIIVLQSVSFDQEKR